MRHPATLLSSLLFALSLAASGCGGDPTCNEACDKVRSCSLSASGLSCSSSAGACLAGDNGCAQCLVDRTCAEISSGACASACPGHRP